MPKFLSQKLDMRVNDYQIILGKEINEEELNSHNFNKVGFLYRRMIKAQRDQIVFFSKNCELRYLTEEAVNTIFPVLDTKSGAAMMYGTSSYLWYQRELLSKFVFQIVRNKIAANKHLKDLQEKLIHSIGKPISSDNFASIWEMGGQKLILEFPKNGHSY